MCLCFWVFLCMCVSVSVYGRESCYSLLPLQISYEPIYKYIYVFFTRSRSHSWLPFHSISKWWHWRVQLSVKNLLYKWWISLDIDAFECSTVSTFLLVSLCLSLSISFDLSQILWRMWVSEWVCYVYVDNVCCICFSFLCCLGSYRFAVV